MKNIFLETPPPTYRVSFPRWWVWVPILVLAAAFAWLPLTLVAGLIGASFALVLALIDPIWALYLAILSVPVQEHILLPGAFTVTQATLLLAAASWSLHILAHPQRFITLGRLFPALLLLICSLILSAITTIYGQTEGLKESLRWSTVVLIYLLTLNVLTASPSDRNTTTHRTWHAKWWRIGGLVFCLLLAPTSNALLGLWQFVAGEGPPSFAIATGPFSRAFGTIGHPNSFAGYLNMGLPLAIALTVGFGWRAWNHNIRPWVVAQRTRTPPPVRIRTAHLLVTVGAASVAASLLAALVASFSRGGWIAALGGGAVLLLIALDSLKQRKRATLWGAAILVGLLLFSMLGSLELLPTVISERIASIAHSLRLFDVRTVQVTPENFAVVERMNHIQAAWNMFLDHPLTGVGPGNFSAAYEGIAHLHASPYTVHPWYLSQGSAHNYYLHMLAEAGLIGSGSYMLLMALLVVQITTALQRTHHWLARSLIAGCCGIIGAVAVHNLFENLHALNMGIQLSAVWGLLETLEKKPFWRDEI